MNNYGERLNAKVRAYNKVNARAMELQPELLAIFRPYVGKKILTNSGFVAKLRPVLEEFRKRVNASGPFQLITGSTSYWLSYTLKAWEPYQGEKYGGASAEATIHVGELGRLGATNGEHCDVARDVLATLEQKPLELRADYSADEVRELRKAAQEAEERAREAEHALYPFGKYDN